MRPEKLIEIRKFFPPIENDNGWRHEVIEVSDNFLKIKQTHRFDNKLIQEIGVYNKDKI